MPPTISSITAAIPRIFLFFSRCLSLSSVEVSIWHAPFIRHPNCNLFIFCIYKIIITHELSRNLHILLSAFIFHFMVKSIRKGHLYWNPEKMSFESFMIKYSPPKASGRLTCHNHPGNLTGTSHLQCFGCRFHRRTGCVNIISKVSVFDTIER